jgi:hypothetical protein
VCGERARLADDQRRKFDEELGNIAPNRHDLGRAVAAMPMVVVSATVGLLAVRVFVLAVRVLVLAVRVFVLAVRVFVLAVRVLAVAGRTQLQRCQECR